MHLFEHIESHLAYIGELEGCKKLQSHLQNEWKKDIESFPWDSSEEKADYLSTALITILVVIRPNHFFLIHGSYHDLVLTNFNPPKTLTVFGMLNLVPDLLAQEPHSHHNWMNYLAIVFEYASSKSHFVAPPIDAVWWSTVQPPILTRVTLQRLKEGLALGSENEDPHQADPISL